MRGAAGVQAAVDLGRQLSGIQDVQDLADGYKDGDYVKAAIAAANLAATFAPEIKAEATEARAGLKTLGKDAAAELAKEEELSRRYAEKVEGSYTNTHESGRTYSGKGSKARSQASGKRVEKETGDKHIATDWSPSISKRDAFKDESRRIDNSGGVDSDRNYNKRESPGKIYRGEDGGDPSQSR